MITTEEYATLKLLAEDIVTAGSHHPSYKRRLLGVNQESGTVYTTFYTKGTVAAVLAGLVRAIEMGCHPALDVLVQPDRPEAEPKKKEKPPEEVDVFTKEALEKIPPGGPDQQILNGPRDKIKGKPLTAVIRDMPPRVEGEEWTDGNGRRWKIVDGKIKQQKKVRNG